MLPHGTGRTMRVAVFAEGDKAREAEEAGADVVGSADLAAKIEGGFTDFDVAIATPDQMGNVGKLGRVLGPRGLMPNPKTGTVTFDIAKAVSDAKAGKLEYRTDRGANVHVADRQEELRRARALENYAALVEEIVRAKPAAAKGRYIKAITLTSTMGPGLHVDPARTRGIVEEFEEASRVWRAATVRQQRPSPKTAGSPLHERRSPAEAARDETASRCLPTAGETPDRLPSRPASAGSSFERRWKMQKADKERVIDELTERLRSAETLLVADYRGLTNSQLEALRVELLEHGARLRWSRTRSPGGPRRRRARTRCSPCSKARRRSRSSRPTATRWPSRRRSATPPGRRKILALRGGVLSGKPDHAARRSRAREAAAARHPARSARRRDRCPVDAARSRSLNAPLQNLVGLIDARIAQLERAASVGDAEAAEAGGRRAGEPSRSREEPGARRPREPSRSAGGSRRRGRGTGGGRGRTRGVRARRRLDATENLNARGTKRDGN